MKRKSYLGSVAALLWLAAACATPPANPEAASTPAIENRDWRLVEVSGRAVTAPPERAHRLRLVSEGRKAVGKGGCNHIGGTYTLEVNSLRFGPLMATKMFCAGVMETEQAFLDALSATTGYRVEGNNLLLLGPDGNLARLQAEPGT